MESPLLEQVQLNFANGAQVGGAAGDAGISAVVRGNTAERRVTAKVFTPRKRPSTREEGRGRGRGMKLTTRDGDGGAVCAECGLSCALAEAGEEHRQPHSRRWPRMPSACARCAALEQRSPAWRRMCARSWGRGSRLPTRILTELDPSRRRRG